MLALRAKTEAGWVLAGVLVLSGFLFFRYLNRKRAPVPRASVPSPVPRGGSRLREKWVDSTTIQRLALICGPGSRTSGMGEIQGKIGFFSPVKLRWF
uniref:Uncharacterized protein n=1 Tax=Candidatus Kentrum sp. LFY TaxID=2126342 RepID=A0A450WU26_9GAMM|nr:MAG: hypothetical protein BECKLFY1418A_GA0070994_100855 [Candidatus Kentron sp. LFY]VFK20510.1 MAG: hypothetical protein BECKLFY1418C_GA0070996_10742 [Candidatus Kentron sp. LFY]